MVKEKIIGLLLNASLFGGVAFILLTLIAMVIYPGGTVHNHEAGHYLFLENFFSDLGRTQDFEGGSNGTSYILFTIALTLVGLTILPIFWAIGEIISPRNKITRVLTTVMAIAGVVAGIGFVGVGWTPWDLGRPIHVMFVNIGFRTLLFCLILLMVSIYRTGWYPNIYAHILAVVSIILLGYIMLMVFGPPPHASREGLMIQVGGQKIIVYLLIGALMHQAFGAKKLLDQGA